MSGDDFPAVFDTRPDGERDYPRIVRICVATTTPPVKFTGKVLEWGTSPAPHLTVRLDTGARATVFLGPGVAVEDPPTEHPGLA